MKKIITGSLITAIVSNNIVYANELENEFEDINGNITKKIRKIEVKN